MSNMTRLSIPMTPAAMIAAPRHLWLATLGAAAVTREWAERDAAAMFRSLIKEGTVVESRAINLVGHRIGSSMKRANALARDARSGVKSSVESLANAASTFVRTKVPTVRAQVRGRKRRREAQVGGEDGEARSDRSPDAPRHEGARRASKFATLSSRWLVRGPGALASGTSRQRRRAVG